jgi:serine/threonine-protein kinase
MIKRLAKIGALILAFLLVAGVCAYLTLTLIIKSEDTVVVPNLVGKDVVSALEILSDLQLNTRVTGAEYNPDFLKNHVLYQQPDPGSEIKKDRDVKIILSRGPRTVTMPNLVSLELPQALMILEENSISQGQLSRTYSGQVDKDHVMAQAPFAGAVINRGTGADLLISLGPRPRAYKMPDLSGRFLDQAMLAIEKVHLEIGQIRTQFDKRLPRNIVVSQEPAAGYRVIENTAVALAVNRPPGKTATLGQHQLLYGSLLVHPVENGFLRKRVQVELYRGGQSTVLFEDYVKPGEQLWLLVPRDQDATVLVFEDGRLAESRVYEAW